MALREVGASRSSKPTTADNARRCSDGHRPYWYCAAGQTICHQTGRDLSAGLGHLLIEDLPSMGKTTLAHMHWPECSISNTGGFSSRVTRYPPISWGGVLIRRKQQQLSVSSGSDLQSAGPLAHEINRTTPKTQSALLEAMEERQFTAEGETRPLPEPFFVIQRRIRRIRQGRLPGLSRSWVVF